MLLVPPAPAGGFECRFEPRRIAPFTWQVVGRHESFSRDNGGHIVTVVFFVTEGGVVLCDTGPPRHLDAQLRAAIARGHRPAGDVPLQQPRPS